jgi:hypothetical protein
MSSVEEREVAVEARELVGRVYGILWSGNINGNGRCQEGVELRRKQAMRREKVTEAKFAQNSEERRSS